MQVQGIADIVLQLVAGSNSLGENLGRWQIVSGDTLRPNSYWPNSYWPNSYWPNSYWPNSYWPNSYWPNSYWKITTDVGSLKRFRV